MFYWNYVFSYCSLPFRNRSWYMGDYYNLHKDAAVTWLEEEKTGLTQKGYTKHRTNIYYIDIKAFSSS